MILPPNASKQEQILTDIINYSLDANSLRGFKFNPQTEMLPWLVAEYGLGEILSWGKKATKSALKEWVLAKQNGIRFQRLRGTPQSLKMALKWANIDNITIQEEPPGEHFAEFQIGISDVPNDFFVDSVIALAKLSAPARSRLMRIFNDYYNAQRFMLDESIFGDLLSDYSGVRIAKEGPVLSFGRKNSFELKIGNPRFKFSTFRSHYDRSYSNDLYRLDVAVLGETEPHTKNYNGIYERSHEWYNLKALYPLPQGLLPEIKFAKALIVLSDSWNLGDINACFAPTAYKEIEHTFYLSEDKLSEQIWNFRRTPILERFSITYYYEAKSFTDQRIIESNLREYHIDCQNDSDLKQKDPIHELENYVAVFYPGMVTWHEHRHLNRPWKNFEPIITKKLDVFSTNLVYIISITQSDMSILTQSGRAAIAASIKEQPIHLAWGSGDSTWESSYKVEKTFTAGGKISLDHHTIKDVKVYTGQTIYQSSIDYIVDGSSGAIERVENGAIIADSVITIEYTQDTPPELITSATLIKEVGRRVVDEVLFCSGDENGELVTPSGRFKPSNVPINNLYLKFTFDFTDAANQVIRELGVMVGTKVVEKLPPGQRYFEPKDIEDHGILLILEHTVPLIRTAATRETFSFVVTF